MKPAGGMARRGGRHGDGGAAVSPAAKLCGFLIMLGIIFGAAYAAGAHAGPVTTRHGPPATGPASPGRPMNMGAPAFPATSPR
jgi:hypothetical protein